MYKKVLVIFFVFFLIFFPKLSFAKEINLPQVSITPDNYLSYSFKRIFEKTILFTKFNNQAKEQYFRELSAVRLSELKNAVDKKYLSDIQQSSERFSAQIGVLTDLVVSNKGELGKDVPAIKELFTNYKIILANLRDKYPANSSFWMLIQHSINSVDLNLAKFK